MKIKFTFLVLALLLASVVSWGQTLTVMPSTLRFNAALEVHPFIITSNTAWIVKSNANWLKFTPASGSNSMEVTVTADANKTGEQRTATITVEGTGAPTRTINVIQSATFYWELTATMSATLDNKGVLTIDTNKNSESMPNDTPWDSRSDSIKSVVFKTGVDSILHYAFSDYKNLASVTMANTIKTIGEGAFENCINLTSITIPNSVTRIGEAAFWKCTGLKSLTLGSSLTTIGIEAFAFCTGLTSVSIPNSVTRINEAAFYRCTGLKSLTLGSSLTTINKEVFAFCTDLDIVTVPASIKTIGEKAFTGCTNLSSLVIGNAVTTIDTDAFLDCSSLTSVTFPNSVKTIGMRAFRDCSSLNSITIPNSVSDIGQNAFQNCSKLKNVKVEWTKPLTVPYNTFNGVNVHDATLHVPAGTESAYSNAQVWKDFTIATIVGNENIESKSLKAWSDNNHIHICGLYRGEPLSIYNLAGQILYQGRAKAEEEHISLGIDGFFIVVAGERRVMVR